MVAAQSFFSEHDLFEHDSETGINVLEWNDRYFISSIGLCNNLSSECGSLVEINSSGDVLWKKQLQWLDPNQETSTIVNDKIYLAGQDPFGLDSLFIYVSSIDGDSLSTFIIPKPDLVEDIYLISMIHYGDHLVLCGNVELESNDAIPGYIAWLNLDGTLDTFRFIEKSLLWNSMKQFAIDPDGFLTLHYHSLDSDTSFNFDPFYHGILKFNENKQEVWHWQSPGFSFGITEGHNFALQSDGTMIYKTAKDGVDAPSLIRVFSNGSFEWLYDFDEDLSYDYTILDVAIASNDDILLCGSYTSLISDIIEIGFVGRLDKDGNPIWFKQFITGYYDEDIDFSWSGEMVWSSLFGLSETDNGNIIATGRSQRWFEDPELEGRLDSDLWILSLDENGCVEEGCDDWQVVSSIIDIESKMEEIVLYPNPSNNLIHLIFKTPLNELCQISILNSMGQVIQIESMIQGLSQHSINVADIPNGLYFVKILSKNNEFVVQSFLKH